MLSRIEQSEFLPQEKEQLYGTPKPLAGQRKGETQFALPRGRPERTGDTECRCDILYAMGGYFEGIVKQHGRPRPAAHALCAAFPKIWRGS
jgi:hypothetical protein